MILLLIAAQAMGPIEAERAFNRDAQTLGQWTAFRKWAAPDAVMFTPQPVKAAEFLQNRKDPPRAVIWWPGESYASCDGKTAINRGPWVRSGGKSVGWFTTVWARRPEGWRWLLDHGDGATTATAASDQPKTRRATCARGAPRGLQPFAPDDNRSRMQGSGASADGTLAWRWSVGARGDRRFTARLWDGRRFVTVLEQRTAGE